MLRILRDMLWALTALVVFALAGPAGAQVPAATPGQATGEAVAAPTAPLVSDPEYRLGDGDVVEVVVIGSSEFNTRARVATDGAVLLPLLGGVPARGSTTGELADRIGASLKKGGYFSNPVVRVELIGIRSRYATVLGCVSSGGLLPLDRAYRLSEIMARVGGASASCASYVVLTPANGEAKRFRISELATGSGGGDPVVQAGDKIYVPAATEEVFYVTGAVQKPGPQNLLADMTVRIALAMAGGVTENGSEKKVTVVRKGEKLKGANLETKLEAGDVLTFGTRLF